MQSSPPILPPGFHDRKTGLVVFGILTIGLGLVCVFFMLLMFASQMLPVQAGVPRNTLGIAPAILTYAGLAVGLVWLGIGSILARRWARALLLIFSWSWLAVGVMASLFMVILMPQIMQSTRTATAPGQPEMPAGFETAMMAMMMVIFGVIYVLLPGAWVFFYRSKHVKATCEARDPVVRWTDRCPLPVLGASLWLACAAPMMLMMAIVYRGVLPVFGTFIYGPVGMAGCVLLALLWGWSARALYKLDSRGWWVVVMSFILFSVSSFVTYSRRDLMEIYVLAGYSPEQLAQLQKFNFLKGPMLIWISLGSLVPMLGYMLYLRKFFSAKEAQ